MSTDPTLPVALPAPVWSGVVDRAVEASLVSFVAGIGHAEDCECDYDYEKNVYTDAPCKSHLDYLRDVCRDAVLPTLATAGLLRSGLVEQSPTVWVQQPEPGPEVTALRDHAGDIWTRADDGCWSRGSFSDHRDFRALLADWGRLTDATEEP